MAADEEEGHLSILSAIEAEVKGEGFTPDTVEYRRRLDQMRVIKCREMRGYPVCTDCEVFDFCELVKKVMRANQGILE